MEEKEGKIAVKMRFHGSFYREQRDAIREGVECCSGVFSISIGSKRGKKLYSERQQQQMIDTSEELVYIYIVFIRTRRRVIRVEMYIGRRSPAHDCVHTHTDTWTGYIERREC